MIIQDDILIEHIGAAQTMLYLAVISNLSNPNINAEEWMYEQLTRFYPSADNKELLSIADAGFLLLEKPLLKRAVEAYPMLRGYIPEVNTPQEAAYLMQMEYRLSDKQTTNLESMLSRLEKNLIKIPPHSLNVKEKEDVEFPNNEQKDSNVDSSFENLDFDYEKFIYGIDAAMFNLEAGSRKFEDFAKQMIYNFGSIIIWNIKSFYNCARDLPEMEEFRHEMTPNEEVSMIKALKNYFKAKINNNIDLNTSYWVTVTDKSEIKPFNSLYNWEIINNEKTNMLLYVVQEIKNNSYRLELRSVGGKALDKKDRRLFEYSHQEMIDNNFKLLHNDLEDDKYWPKTLNDAIIELILQIEENELQKMKIMSWEDIQDSYGSLSQWIRNYFGLWRGNFDLLSDPKIDNTGADNASLSILFHFWKFITKD